MADAGYLTIGKVVKRLQAQYPDLSVSKVRYLEDEGLLTPSRTPGGYRLYSARDVRRLETILHLQKTKFLPLSVIKAELDGKKDASEDAVLGTAGSGVSEPDPALHVDPEAERELHPIEKMPDVLGVSIGFVRSLAECGIIGLVRSPHGRDLVRGQDLRLIRACEELRRFGIEPKNLRQYIAAANRESIMFEQALASLSRHQGETETDRKFRADQTFDRMFDLTNVVRASLLRRALKATLPSGY